MNKGEKKLNKFKNKRVGEIGINHQNFLMTIIEYNSYRDVVVEFHDKYNTRKHDEYFDFKKGHIENPSVHCLYDHFIAYKEDVKNNRLAFEKYRAMLDRCYGKQEGNNIVYKDCKVSKEWRKFENFIEWFNENYYQIDNMSMDLDKDIFGDGKLYSPNTCVFIPHKLNSQFARRKNNNKDLPLGVTIHKRGNGNICYRVCILPKNQLYENIEEASNAYQSYIKQQYKDFAEKYKNIIPQKLYDALINFKFSS